MKSVFTIILILSISLSAAFVKKEKAQKVAENFYKNRCPEVSAKIGAKVVNVHQNLYMGEVTRYTVEFEQGFVIVTSNDQLKPILGYSDHGTVPDPDKLGGENFKEWIEEYDRQLFCGKSGKYVDDEAVKEWKNIENNIFPKSYDIVVDRLVESKWDQLYPWNDQCPEKDSTWTYVGCVATAMAQLVKYHQWPVSGEGSVSYDWNGETLAADFSTLRFGYSMMKDEVEIQWGLYPEYWESINMNQSELDMLASLSYNMGLSVEMSYGTTADGGSGASMPSAHDALLNHWKAGSSDYYSLGTPLNPEEDATLIQGELDAKRPWLWAGGVHAFILDGYTSDHWYHFNWGWAGDFDGWYQRIFLVPDGVGCKGAKDDYTYSQIGITYVPSIDPFAVWPSPENFTGQLLNNEDVQLTWTKPSTGDPISYNIYKSVDHLEQKLLGNTTSLSFNDLDLSIEDYAYSIRSVYSDGESHFTDSYYVQITELEEYPIVKYLSAITVGRTNIDLAWTIPFVGVIYDSEDFENGRFSDDWITKTSLTTNEDAKPSLDWWEDDINYWVSITTAAANPHIVIRPGYYACIFSTSATANLWLFSPEYTYSSTSVLKFWTRFKYGDGDGGTQNTKFRVVAYTGFFDENRDCEYDVLGTFDSSIDPVNEWESEWEINLAPIDGQTKRVGFCVPINTNDYFTFAIDDIVIGQTSGGVPDDPTGYEIYRNGLLAETINDSEIVFWSDTNFADGDNEYFVRTLYPTGQSIPSDKVIAIMDANPKPDYLSVNTSSNEVDLSWYMPYGSPPHWSTYIAPEKCTTTVDWLSDTDCARRRVEFRAEDLGLYYPVTIDSIAAAFYEWEDDLWGANTTFVIRLWYGHPINGDSLLYESGTLTATPGEVYKVSLPISEVLNSSWNVEVETFDTVNGHPSTLAGASTSGINSYFYYTAESSYNYYVSYNSEPLSYCILAHVTGGDPDPIVKSGWTAEKELVEKLPKIDIRNREITDLKITGKGLDYYKIYRNAVEIGTTTTTTFTDNEVILLKNKELIEYFVTACYVNPVGESEGSNIVNVDGFIQGPDPFYTSVELDITGSLITITWEALADATGYNVYSSVDPYGIFTLEGSTTELFYETTITEGRNFYFVTGTNGLKQPVKEIEIKKSNLNR
ncbi:MAG: C10 family peptidase [Candidatus Delongbacteria bacterium]|nr:C10 family peptidase [Candidatus Delongbacteria bacterium]